MGSTETAPAPSLDSRKTSPSAASFPKLTDEQIAANRRTADHLKRINGTGDLPRFTADAIKTNGDKAVTEVSDLIGQASKNNPEQARELYNRTAAKLPPEARRRLDEAMNQPMPRPDIIDEAGASHHVDGSKEGPRPVTDKPKTPNHEDIREQNGDRHLPNDKAELEHMQKNTRLAISAAEKRFATAAEAHNRSIEQVEQAYEKYANNSLIEGAIAAKGAMDLTKHLANPKKAAKRTPLIGIIDAALPNPAKDQYANAVKAAQETRQELHFAKREMNHLKKEWEAINRKLDSLGKDEKIRP